MKRRWHSKHRRCAVCGPCGKNIYETLEHVQIVAGNKSWKTKQQIFYYQCPHGNGYHLTRLPQETIEEHFLKGDDDG